MPTPFKPRHLANTIGWFLRVNDQVFERYLALRKAEAKVPTNPPRIAQARREYDTAVMERVRARTELERIKTMLEQMAPGPLAKELVS